MPILRASVMASPVPPKPKPLATNRAIRPLNVPGTRKHAHLPIDLSSIVNGSLCVIKNAIYKHGGHKSNSTVHKTPSKTTTGKLRGWWCRESKYHIMDHVDLLESVPVERYGDVRDLTTYLETLSVKAVPMRYGDFHSLTTDFACLRFEVPEIVDGEHKPGYEWRVFEQRIARMQKYYESSSSLDNMSQASSTYRSSTSSSSSEDGGYGSKMEDVVFERNSEEEHGAEASAWEGSMDIDHYASESERVEEDLEMIAVVSDEGISMDHGHFTSPPTFAPAPAETFTTRPAPTPFPAPNFTTAPASFARPTTTSTFPPAPAFTPAPDPPVSAPSGLPSGQFSLPTMTPIASNGVAKQPAIVVTAPITDPDEQEAHLQDVVAAAKSFAARANETSNNSKGPGPAGISPFLAVPPKQPTQAQMSNPSNDEVAALSSGIVAPASTSSPPAQPISSQPVAQTTVQKSEEPMGVQNKGSFSTG